MCYPFLRFQYTLNTICSGLEIASQRNDSLYAYVGGSLHVGLSMWTSPCRPLESLYVGTSIQVSLCRFLQVGLSMQVSLSRSLYLGLYVQVSLFRSLYVGLSMQVSLCRFFYVGISMQVPPCRYLYVGLSIQVPKMNKSPLSAKLNFNTFFMFVNKFKKGYIDATNLVREAWSALTDLHRSYSRRCRKQVLVFTQRKNAILKTS